MDARPLWAAIHELWHKIRVIEDRVEKLERENERDSKPVRLQFHPKDDRLKK